MRGLYDSWEGGGHQFQGTGRAEGSGRGDEASTLHMASLPASSEDMQGLVRSLRNGYQQLQ